LKKSFKTKILENLFFPLGDFIMRTEVGKQLKIQRSYNTYNKLELETLQLSKLNTILEHATYSCTFYKKYKMQMEDPLVWLTKFPILSKKEISGKTDDFISNKFKKDTLIKYETSGSSGIRSTVYLDRKEQSICRAILLNWWEWNGYYIGKPLVQTGISPDRGIIKSLKDFLLSTLYIDAFGLTEPDILKKLDRVKNKKGMHLFGYASSLYVIAKVAGKNNIQLKFDLAMSQGDKLFDHYQKAIEEEFDTKVVEDYGCNEGMMIGQKKDLPYFYIYTPHIYLELVDDHGNLVPDGKIGRVIITKLDGFAMPLIRYDTGDLAIKLPLEKYPAKRDMAFPLLEKVIGRNTDIIKTPDGKSLIVHTFTGIFEFFPEIIQFQVVQNELDKITIKYIPSEDFNLEILTKIEASFIDRTKSKIEINWESVSEILPSKSGKPQLIINNLIKKSLADIQ